MFAVGDKVVCISDFIGFPYRTHPNGKPQKGQLYVVSQVGEKHGVLGVWIVGVPSVNSLGEDCGWRAYRFRKLSDIQAENKAKRQAKKGVAGRIGAKGFSHQNS